jgi:hypothetical protein
VEGGGGRMNDERVQIRLLMNSDQAKEIKNWLLADMLLEFDLFCWKISIWRTWPYIVID